MSKIISPIIILAAGGTGGHMFPAFSLAQEFIQRGYKIYIFTDERGKSYKNKDVQAELITFNIKQREGHLFSQVSAIFSLIRSTFQARMIIKQLKPEAVVGFGGYVSFPIMLAALSLRYPTLIHQADAILGRANRFFAPFVTKVATSFPQMQLIKKAWISKVVFTGLPLRPDILRYKKKYELPTAKKPFRLFIIGGSQGARVFGEVVPQALALLPPASQKRFHIYHQARREFLETVRRAYEKTKAQVFLAPFFDNMGEQYSQAHLIITRSGASSTLEVASMERPAIFVPYKYAMDNHQMYNAQAIVNEGGGWLIEEKNFTPQVLAEFLNLVLSDPLKLRVTSQYLKKFSLENATKQLADLVENLVTVLPYRRKAS